MALASANRVAVRYIAESTFGTTPVAGNPKNLRLTGESLSYGITSETSKEIRSDRQITDVVLTGASASGGINVELSYREYDTIFEAGFMGTWVEYGTAGLGAALSLTLDSAAGTLTAGVAPTGNDAFANLAVGQWFRLTAPSDAADGAYLRVASRTSTVITVATATPIPGSGSRAVANSVIASSRLTNGTTERFFTIEKEFQDVDQFFAFRGMEVSKLSFSFQSGAIVTGSFDFIGKDSVTDVDTTLPGTPVASQTYDVCNAVTGVGQIMENGSPLTSTFIKSLKFDLDNKLRGQTAIGTFGNVGIGSGTLELKGEMEVYLKDGTMYDKFVNNTASAVSWTVHDGAGNGYVLTFPKVKFNDAKVQAGGLDQDVMLNMPFTALMDATTGKTVFMDRLGA